MKLQKKLLSLLTGSVLLLSAISVADDTDLYLGRGGAGGAASDTGLRPNLLFVLDTSGSMAWYDEGATGSRMTRMRSGLKEVIRNAANVNVGLMRFHTSNGGPVLYPIKYIDEVIEDNSNNEFPVNVRVGENSDDAEENLSNGTVKLDDSIIEMAQLSAGGSTGPVIGRQDNQFISDPFATGVTDAEERLSNRTVDLNSPDLDVGYDIPNNRTMLVATQFQNVNIPKGSKIAYASIEFTTENPSSLTQTRYTDFYVWGEKDGNPNPLQSSSRNISDRSRTSQQVTWTGPAEAIKGEKIPTPNLATLVQAIVDEPSWDEMNPMTFILEGQGRRRFYSYEGALNAGNPDFAPKLSVYFARPGETMSSVEIKLTNRYDNAYQFRNTVRLTQDYILGPRWSNYTPEIDWGFRFPNLPVPQGAPILGAEIELTNLYNSYYKSPSHMVFRLEDTPDSPNFWSTYYTTKISDRDLVSDASTASGHLEMLWRNVPGGTYGDKFQTPDLTNLIQRGVDRPDWAAGNSMTLIASNPYPSTTTNEPRVYASPGNRGDRDGPILRVWYLDASTVGTGGGSGSDGEKQRVGVRFQNVDIPQGATITEAYLDFTASGDESGDATIEIRAELEGNAPTYGDGSTGAAPTLTERTNLSSSVEWKSGSNLDEWETDNVYSSPDLTDMVQQVVSNGDWCGGNAMSFLMEGEGRRSFHSYDTEPTKSPLLRVKYKVGGIGPGEGCTRKTVTKQIYSGVDDGEEYLRSNSMSDSSWTLEAVRLAGSQADHWRHGQLVGFRWSNIDVPPGAEILEARMKVYARGGSHTENVDWQIFAESPGSEHDPAGNFDWVNKLISERDLTGTSVNWSFNDAWTTQGAEKVSPDLTSLVQEVVNSPGWRYKDPLVLVLDGEGRRDILSYDGDPASAAKIEISFRANLGDTDEFNTVRTVRDILIDTIDGLSAYGGTPLMDTYWEGARYMTGREVVFGKTRGAGPEFDWFDVRNGAWALDEAHVRSVSHPESWTGGAISHDVGMYGNCSETPYGGCVDIPSQCSVSNPAHPSCRTEYISGNPTYIAPSVEACSGSHIVLLTDGTPNSAHSHWAGSGYGIPDTIGVNCESEITIIDAEGNPTAEKRAPNDDGGESCGPELAQWLNETDHVGDTEHGDFIRTHTIGFNLRFDLEVDQDDPNDPNIDVNERNKLATEFLREVATQGGGDTYVASDSAELISAFNNILADAIRAEGSFTAPALAVNSFNQLFNRPTAFLTTFESDKTAIWSGNIKKFRICPFMDDSRCTFGELIDENVDAAVLTTGADAGMLSEDISDVWGPDDSSARAVAQGGTGSRVKDWRERLVYTYSEDVSDPGTNLVAISATRDMEAGNRDAIRLMLGASGQCDSGGDPGCLDSVISFMLGARTNPDSQKPAAPADTSVSPEENRWPIADSLHGQPVIISYGGHADIEDEDNDGDTTETIPLSKVLWGTNDGAIHFVDERTGEEEWIFYPQEVLGRMEALEKNDPTTKHIYGIDTSPVTRTFDKNADGIINPADGDYVHVYMGMRRGGRSIYAIDITPSGTITSAGQQKVTPKLLWTITGGVTPGFELLGQTWSKPKPTVLRTVGANGTIQKRTVLIFGGGHDSNSADEPDSPADGVDWEHTENSTGRAIYVVDADTGERLWTASKGFANASAGQPDKVVDEMMYSFPSNLTFVDSDYDGYNDRVYGIDLGGQIWRVDLHPQLYKSTIARLAVLGHAPSFSGGSSDRTHARRFHYELSVAQVIDDEFSSGDGRYDLLTAVSGNRADPLDIGVQNRAYMIRDYLVDERIDDVGSNYPGCNPEQGCDGGAGNGTPISDAPGTNDLVDLTDPDYDPETAEISDAVKEDLRKRNGWFFDLNLGAGEKGFARTTIFDGKLYFPTFVPADASEFDSESCSVAIGQSYLYSVNILNAAPAHTGWMGSNPNEYELGDRVLGLGDGAAGEAVIWRGEEGTTVIAGGIGGGGGSEEAECGNGIRGCDSQAHILPPRTFWHSREN